LGKKKWQNQVYFLLSLGNQFKRYTQNQQFYSFWVDSQNSFILGKKIISLVLNLLEEEKKPLTLDYLVSNLKTYNLPKAAILSSLQISKKIQRNQEGVYGLKDWSEIHPRGVKDKAYLVFQKERKPLHFSQVASLIGDALPQTVHNELIKDQRFVLVGRGIYALREWGYEPGYVKDVIFKTLRESKRPLTKEEILEKVLKQRQVKENTVFLNLNNKKYFFRTPEGKYKIREA